MKVKEELIDNPYVDDITDLEIIEDFLPPPHALAKARHIVTITIPLNAETIEFYTLRAQAYKIPVKELMKQVLEAYAVRRGNNAAEPGAPVAAD
ncbi:MAG: hypothetical protein U0350_30810 [Caldilineaceae bacterium]